MMIGKKIRKIRELNDFTQEYMGIQLDIGTTAYANIESDKSDPKWSRICHITELLNVSPHQLIIFDPEKLFVSIQELTDSVKTESSGGDADSFDRERNLYEGQIELLDHFLK